MIKATLDLNAFKKFLFLTTIDYSIDCVCFECQGDTIKSGLRTSKGMFAEIIFPNFLSEPIIDYTFNLLSPKENLLPYLNVFGDTVDIKLDDYKIILSGDGFNSKIKLHDPVIVDTYKRSTSTIPGEIIHSSSETELILTTIKQFKSLNQFIYFNFMSGEFVISSEIRNAHSNVLTKHIESTDVDDDISFQFDKLLFNFLKVVDGTFTTTIRKIEKNRKTGCILTFENEEYGIHVGLASKFD